MTETGYETDFYAWLQTQAAHLRAKEWNGLDLDHLAEELDTLGRREPNAVSRPMPTPDIWLRWRRTCP